MSGARHAWSGSAAGRAVQCRLARGPGAQTCRYADAALLELRKADGTVPSASVGQLARTAYYSYMTPSTLDVIGTRTITEDDGDGHLLAGTGAHKIGRTTGDTWGETSSTCVTFQAPGQPTDYSTGIPRTPTYLCHWIVFHGASQGGDSGAPVYNIWSDNMGGIAAIELAGILHSGVADPGSPNPYFVFSPMSGVRGDLGSMITH